MSPATVPGGVWFYIPSQPAAILFTILFGVIGCIVSYHAFRGGIRRFFAVVVIGILMEVGGFACRAVARHKLDEIAPFAVQQSLIVLAPLFIAAGNYMIISRLIMGIAGASNAPDNDSNERIFLVSVRRITPIFITCDVVTILIQVSGTSISAGANWKGSTASIGSDILLAGLAIQTLTVALFVAICLKFGGRGPFDILSRSQEQHFRGLQSIFVSSVFIELRCTFRLIEHATGYDGYLFTDEWDFYVFEALPMIVAIGIFAFWYPPHFVPKLGSKRLQAQKEIGHGLQSLEDGTTG